MDKILLNIDFFNQLAEYYDLMIPFAKAVERKKDILKNIITPDQKYAADFGCGTGTDSIALAQLGLYVTSFDPSSEMIEKASSNALNEKVKVDFLLSNAANTPKIFNEYFDLIISLGNTFANIRKQNLFKSLKRCHEVLKKGGILLIQILNYQKILSGKERIVNITESDAYLFIRFYDFNSGHIVFNSLKVAKSKLSDYSLISTKVYPHLKTDFEKLLSKLNFASVEFHSDLQLSPYIESSSKNMIIRCTK